ncbi:MAG: rRNA maturation RNase YbeY [Deltaproteobacteria bacterium]|nr:rRNA maturation RNase YbeY [Deltaproteobacteria bacterium]MBW2570949.1 rRNA maturation RNase YbeY [Deltaproteobacteria bacterium]MBW2710772.1 rRNA maturation RNase YbeY [Deltaproteobacteria bacterium]
MEVLIDNRQKKHEISLKQIQQRAKAVLNALDCPDAELSILIVDDPQIAVLNKQYLNRNGPTNVIAFPMRTGPFTNITPQLLGDVLISVETALREGNRVGISMEERFTQLLVHGILHLLGYDHETSDQDAHEMEKKSDEILKLINT